MCVRVGVCSLVCPVRERENCVCVCVCLILCNENEPCSDAQNRQKNYQTHTLHKGLNRALCNRILVGGGGGSNKF